MFFEKDNVSFNILDVLLIDQDNVTAFNSGRNFSALSFRYHADTVVKTDKNEYCLKDNSVLYVPARLDYSRASKRDEMIVVHFETTSYNAKCIECFDPEVPERLAVLFARILDCWEKKEIGYKLKSSAILYEILAECYAQNYKNTLPSSKIQASVNHMNQSFRNSDLTIKEIAEKSFVSEVYFRKLFKAEFGISPQKYIINLRIQHATGLISTGYYSLTDVAYMSGYGDYKYFSVEFKKAIGVSPSQYGYSYSENTKSE